MFAVEKVSYFVYERVTIISSRLFDLKSDPYQPPIKNHCTQIILNYICCYWPSGRTAVAARLGEVWG